MGNKMMKIALTKPVRDEKGQAFILSLVLLLVGSLIITPLLGLMSTGLIAGQANETKMDELYAADAGVEDALWKLMNDPPDTYPDSYQLTNNINGLSVSVTIEVISGPTYKITSTAGGTTIEAYLTVPAGHIPGDLILGDGEEIEGSDVSVGGDLILGNDAEIEHGNVSVTGDIILGLNAEIEHGNVCAGGDIILGVLAEIEHGTCVCTLGDLILGENAKIEDIDVYVAGDLTLGDNAKIDGNVYVGGDITLGAGATITGSINPYQECPCLACLPFFGIQTWDIN